MSESLSVFLLAVFSIHLVVFSGVYCRSKKKYHLLFALVFLFLVLSYTMRLWGADLHLHGHAVHDCLRSAAWITTAFAAIIWMRQMRKN